MSPLTAALVRAVVFLLWCRCALAILGKTDFKCQPCTLRREVEKEAA